MPTKTTADLFDTPPPLGDQPSVIPLKKESQFILRPYQGNAVDKGLGFLNAPARTGHEFQILPTGSGKSLIIANIAKELGEPAVILQPSKEILEQNHKKLASYGYMAAKYSASVGSKFVGQITYATIGSVVNKPHIFRHCKYLLIDECDLVNAKNEESMYSKFIKSLDGIKVLGFTATPYRLSANMYGAQLKFLNRTRPKIFNNVNYYIQNKVLFDEGYLSKLEYFPRSVIDRKFLELNKSGTDFTESSLKAYYRRIDMVAKTTDYANRLLAKRKNLLVFCSLIDEAYAVSEGVPGSMVITGDTDPVERASILWKFTNGTIPCVINVGVLTVGFDYPELECILLARSTMSLRLYYQIFGRGLRIHPEKSSCWLVDLGGNIEFFGKLETMQIRIIKGLYSIWNNGKCLTNVNFTKY